MNIVSDSDRIVALADKSNSEWRKGGGSGSGFVEQDKGPCGTVRHFWRFLNEPPLFLSRRGV
jgi:hypothetical protein